MTTLNIPAITSLDPDQLQSVYGFMDQVRQGDIAAIEATRLEPYFEGYAQQILRDLNAQGDERLKAVAEPKKLAALFKRVADRTDNTIISGILIAPEGTLKHKSLQDNKLEDFSGKMKYRDRTFTFSFLQIFGTNSKKSISIPVMEYEAKMMAAIFPYLPEKLLLGLQSAMTASNHDMLHQFTNHLVHEEIARTSKPDSVISAVFNWGVKYGFTKTPSAKPESYESWLMLNHMHVFNRLESGKDGADLRAGCDSFFDELRRVSDAMCGDDMPKEDAHAVIDYFGTMYCFALARFLPLNHPVIDQAIERLRQADPDPDAIQPAVAKALTTEAAEAIHNYAAIGMDLSGTNADYAVWKKRDLIDMAPERTHLLSPARPGSTLAKAQERVGEINRNMVLAVLDDMDFELPDGVHTFTKDGVTVTKHILNNDLHNDTGPALTVVTPKHTTQVWCEHGDKKSFVRKNEFGEQLTKRFEGGILRSKQNLTEYIQIDTTYENDGSSYEETINAGTKTQVWRNPKGQPHRIGAPAKIMTEDGVVMSKDYYVDGTKVDPPSSSAPKTKKPQMGE